MPPRHLQPDQATHAAVLTPPGRGAVAVVRVAGPNATSAIDRCFRAANGRSLAEQPLNAIRFGLWIGRDEQAGEELVVCRTGERSAEVHCHGGDAAVRAVLTTLQAAGCLVSDWNEPLAAGSGVIAQEATQALAHCTTDRAAAVLLEQLGSALEAELQQAITLLQAGDLAGASTVIDTLLQRAAVGLHLATPWRVVLAGAPNVGKSSLINALVGFERSIVYDQPGVTRDVVTSRAAIDGWPIELSDTAGLRETDDPVEAAGAERARQSVARCDLLVLVEEAGSGALPLADLGVEPLTGEQSLVRVANKCDVAPEPEASGRLAVSATTGRGIENLARVLGATLVPKPPPPGAGVPLTLRQVDLLREARARLEANQPKAAAEAMSRLATTAPVRG